MESDTLLILDQHAVVIADANETPVLRIYLNENVLRYQYWISNAWSNPAELATPNGGTYLHIYTTTPPVSGTRVGSFIAQNTPATNSIVFDAGT